MMKEYYDYVAHEVLINLKDGSKPKGIWHRLMTRLTLMTDNGGFI